jgi:hypothetical protein
MRDKYLFLFTVLGVFILLSSCSFPTPCTGGTLSAPNLVSPAMWEVVSSLTPTLSWSYPTSSSLKPLANMNQGVELNLFPGVNQTTNLDFNPSPNLDPYPHPYPYLYPYFHPHLYPFLYPLIPKLFPHIPIHFKYPNPYPYANAYPPPVGSCIPESYRLHLSTGPNFADDMVYAVSGTSWTPSSPLESGKEYRWGVEALSGGGTKFAGYRAFFTGRTHLE